MTIDVRKSWGILITVKDDDDYSIMEDVEERLYPYKTPEGKVDTSKCERDIKESALDMFVDPLNYMISIRVKPYDSSDLIKALFEKLPKLQQDKLILELCKDY